MSYELIFWKEQAGRAIAAGPTYEALSADRPVDGLEDLPIHEWLSAVLGAFPGASVEPNGREASLDWTSADESESFQLTWSPVHVRVDCRGMSREHMNRLVGIGADFGCPLYDPQTSERFDSWTDR